MTLDMLIGFLLLISICIFYEKTIVFFDYFNYWSVMLIIIPIILLINTIQFLGNTFADLSKSTQDDKSQGILREILIPNLIDLLKMALGALVWLVPMMIDLIFAGLAVFIAKSLNHQLNLDDVYLICLTPLFCLIPLCYFSQLQNIFSKDARYSVGCIGIIANTLVIEFGGYASAKALSLI
jgi:hypothetical protein